MTANGATKSPERVLAKDRNPVQCGNSNVG
jgi:hypothetical protein